MLKNCVLLIKAYPYAQQGTQEAEKLGQLVLVSQFVAGLLEDIKVDGIEGGLHKNMKELIQSMMEQVVIWHSSSPWASPVMLVEKRDGSYWFCVDHRRLNTVTKMNVFPLPRVDDTLDMVSQAWCFSTLDLLAGHGYLQVQDYQEKMAFSTYSEHYVFYSDTAILLPLLSGSWRLYNTCRIIKLLLGVF